ncbi:ornithine cyclodeaminase [Thermocladium modestius]|uniref:Ornithine cyclodeaminase n=2 Tax=Thermocladium modestius TaxID=62609 RepID=A0A830GXT9_9CREN|nr:ornithine cyclodeaminase [Thermocladium modestius]
MDMLLIREDEVFSLLGFDEAIEAVEDGFKLMGLGQAVNTPRRRTIMPNAVLHVLQGSVLGNYGVAGLKAYLSTKRGTRFVVLLFGLEEGEPLAVIEADWLGRVRTGAASAVAARHMARTNAEVLGLVGTGGQARTQFEALSRVMKLRLVKVMSRSRKHAEDFARFVGSRGFDAKIVDDYGEACDADVLVTATNSKDPFIDGKRLASGIHVNAVGSNWPNRAELMPSAVERAAVIAVDDVEQAKLEAGDLIMAGIDWSRVVGLSEVVLGRVKGRPSDDAVTIFKSMGIAVEDLVVGKLVYEKALKKGMGIEVEFKGFHAFQT